MAGDMSSRALTGDMVSEMVNGPARSGQNGSDALPEGLPDLSCEFWNAVRNNLRWQTKVPHQHIS